MALAAGCQEDASGYRSASGALIRHASPGRRKRGAFGARKRQAPSAPGGDASGSRAWHGGAKRRGASRRGASRRAAVFAEIVLEARMWRATRIVLAGCGCRRLVTAAGRPVVDLIACRHRVDLWCGRQTNPPAFDFLVCSFGLPLFENLKLLIARLVAVL